MGALFSSVLNKLWSQKEVRILILGLDGAGKTTILYRFIDIIYSIGILDIPHHIGLLIYINKQVSQVELIKKVTDRRSSNDHSHNWI